MQPDWSTADGRVQLYLGDCLDVLPTLPAGSVDAVVTDPPYGILNVADGKTLAIRKSKRAVGSGKLKNRRINTDDFAWDSAPPSREALDAMLSVSRDQIIWGGELLRPAAGAVHSRVGQAAAVAELLATRTRVDVARSTGGVVPSLQERHREATSDAEAAAVDAVVLGILARSPKHSRSLHGQRHYRRRLPPHGPAVHRDRKRKKVFRHRRQSHRGGTESRPAV